MAVVAVVVMVLLQLLPQLLLLRLLLQLLWQMLLLLPTNRHVYLALLVGAPDDGILRDITDGAAFKAGLKDMNVPGLLRGVGGLRPSSMCMPGGKPSVVIHTTNLCLPPSSAGELCLHVVLAADPFQPYKDDKGYSVQPFVLCLVSAPAWMRWHHGLFTTLGLLPGMRKRGSKVRPGDL